MHSVRFTAQSSSAGILERDFLAGEVPGVLWSPQSATGAAPLVLMGHGGGLHKKTPAQAARARDTVASWGYHVVAIDAPGHGERPRTAADDQARSEMREAMTTGDHERFKAVSIDYTRSLATRAVP